MADMANEAERQAAAQWVARMDSAVWSMDDEAEFQHWLAQSPSRHGLFLQTHAAWMMADAARQAEQGAAADSPAVESASAHGWRRRGLLGGLAAAGVASVLTVRHATARSQSFVTQLGEIRRVPLNDGSIMTINSDTQLKVQIAKNVRQINLTQGEAWFDVAKDATRPFVVESGDVKARAVGTAFSVRTREAGVEVLVTEGVVETWSENDEAQKILVSAGERALVSDRAVVHYRTDGASSVDRALAWRSGMIDLNGTTLREAAEEFNRYNQRQIVIADPDVAAEQFDGLFRVNDPEGFADALSTSLNIAVDRSDPDVIRIERTDHRE